LATSPAALTDRCLEVHSSYVWDYRHMQFVLDFAAEHEMTGIVLHRNDLVDLVVFPGRYFGADAPTYRNNLERYRDMYEAVFAAPTRGDRPCRARTYVKRLIDEAGSRGLDVFIQNKELFFDDTLVDLHPEVIKEGRRCASHPFWLEFVRAKYDELVVELPGLAGVIVAPGTAESRVSIASNRCSCGSCRATDPGDWYAALLGAMREPLKAAGCRLVVRDFTFSSEAQAAVVDAVAGLPDDIVVSLKNTPHDYYPTFPHNPRIGEVGGHDQWIELDCMGQFFGWGVAPSVMLDDMRLRFAYARSHGVTGVILRTDWEGLDGHTAFDTYNRINVCGAAALARDPDVPDLEIYGHWLAETDMLAADSSVADRSDAADWCRSLLGRTWEIISNSLFVRSCVFSESSCIPVSMADAVWVGEVKDGLRDWDSRAADALVATAGNVRRIVEAEDGALALAMELRSLADAGHRALTPRAHETVRVSWDLLCRYVEAYRLAVVGVFLTRYLQNQARSASEVEPDLQRRWSETVASLGALARNLDTFYRSTAHPYPVYMLLDGERVATLCDSLQHEGTGGDAGLNRGAARPGHP
jgi:hypothetical protein